MITRSETILIVEDDAQIRNFISYVLQQEGFPHLSAGTAKNALSLLVTNPVDLVLLDLGLPDCDGCDQKNQRMVGNTDYRRVGEGSGS